MPGWHQVIAELWRNVVVVVVGLAEDPIQWPLAELHTSKAVSTVAAH